MTDFEVPEPIICSPYDEPAEHWHIVEGEVPERRGGRRPAMYFYNPPGPVDESAPVTGIAIELKLVNLIRDRVKAWRAEGWPGASSTTLQLLQYWRRDGRQHRLFFAQLEAVPLLIITPLTFLGGSFYSINMLPPFWQTVSLFNPVVYLVSGFRWSFYGLADVSVGVSLVITGVFLAVSLALVAWIFRTGYRLKT